MARRKWAKFDYFNVCPESNGLVIMWGRQYYYGTCCLGNFPWRWPAAAAAASRSAHGKVSQKAHASLWRDAEQAITSAPAGAAPFQNHLSSTFHWELFPKIEERVLGLIVLFLRREIRSEEQTQRSRLQREKPNKPFQEYIPPQHTKTRHFSLSGWYFLTLFSFKLFCFTGYMSLVNYATCLLLNALGGSLCLLMPPARIKS